MDMGKKVDQRVKALLKRTQKVPDIDWLLTLKKLKVRNYQQKLTRLKICPELSVWKVPMLKEVTIERILDCLTCAGVKIYSSIDLSNQVFCHDRDPLTQGSYVATFIRAKNALNDAYMQKVFGKGKPITFLERLVLEAGFFFTTGFHLDSTSERITLCKGSWNAKGKIPSVHWYMDDQELCIYLRDGQAADMFPRWLIG